MIKDSKIIGIKIAAPYGWKKFKVGELFDVCTTTGFDAGKLVFSNEGTPFIGRTDNNYGFQGFVNGIIGVNSNPANVISISQIGSQSAQYRKEPWYASQNMFYVELLDFNLTLYVGLFFVSIFNKLLQQYSGYTSYPTKNSIFDWIIDLPVESTNKPDFAWMEQYMKLVQEDYLQQKKLSNQAEIKAYLTESQTDSLEITDADREFLREFDKLPRRKFKVGDLFDIETPVSKINASDVQVSNNGINYVVRTSNNNGIRCKIVCNNSDVNVGNALSFGQDTGTIFYQRSSFVTGDKIKILRMKHLCLTSEFALFLISLLHKQLSYFSWGSSSYSVDVITDLILNLPVLSNSQVDMHSIEKYIQIQSKPLINNVSETLAPVGGGDFN